MQRVARKEDRETRGEGGGGGVLSYKRLMGMYRWMRSHFHDWIDYNGVAFTRMRSHIFGFFGIRQFFIFTVSRCTRMFVP